jgi:ketosteroid isomerase-like protein
MSAKEKIPALVAEWNEKVRQRDVEACVGFNAPDGAFMPPNAPAAIGHAAMRQAWEAMFALPNLRLTFGPTAVDEAAAGDMAYEIGTWAIGFDTPQGRHEDHGKYVVVWKNFSGTWKAVADIFNSDVALTGRGSA